MDLRLLDRENVFNLFINLVKSEFRCLLREKCLTIWSKADKNLFLSLQRFLKFVIYISIHCLNVFVLNIYLKVSALKLISQ